MPKGATAAYVPAMLQRLLEELFHLSIRHELRSMPVYSLEVAEEGPRLQPCTVSEKQKPKTPAERIAERSNALHTLKPGECPTFQVFVDRDESILVEANTVDGLIRGLQRSYDRPVLDHTGLKGNFAIAFQASPMIGEAAESAGHPTITAILKKFGLRLVPRREDLEYVVVVDCDKVPTEN